MMDNERLDLMRMAVIRYQFAQKELKKLRGAIAHWRVQLSDAETSMVTAARALTENEITPGLADDDA